MHLNPLDIFIILAFIVYAIWAGVRSSGVASKNLEEYFLAGRSLPGWKAGLSMAATQFAADTPLWITGLIATTGIFGVWRLWIYALAFLMLGFLLAHSWRNVNVITDAELTEVRYGTRPALVLRGIKAFYFGTVFNCLALGIVLLATTFIAEPFLVWNEWLPSAVFDPVMHLVQGIGTPLAIDKTGPDVWVKTANNMLSVIAIVTVTTFYSTTGGLRSVVNTDVVQFFIMMAGTLLYAIIVISAVGGLGALPDQLGTLFAEGGYDGINLDQLLSFEPSQAKDITLVMLTVIAVQWIANMNADGTGYLAQRTMACRSDKDAKVAVVIFTAVQLIVRNLLWVPIGLGLLILFPPDFAMEPEAYKAAREATYVQGIATLLPVGVKGLLLTGMLAALASTVDSHLNWGASYWSNDLYKRILCQKILKKEPSDRSLVWVARCATILILVIALVLMAKMSAIQTAQTMVWVMGAGFGPVLVMRWFWWRTNAWAEIACIVSSIVFVPLLATQLTGDMEPFRILILLAITIGVAVAASYIGGPETDKTLRAFYKKARPPGFWGPVAEALGEDPAHCTRRFYRGVFTVLCGAFSIFCILVGLGSWICNSPAPLFFPWKAGWIIAMLAIGGGLIPVWWKSGFHEPAS